MGLFGRKKPKPEPAKTIPKRRVEMMQEKWDETLTKLNKKIEDTAWLLEEEMKLNNILFSAFHAQRVGSKQLVVDDVSNYVLKALLRYFATVESIDGHKYRIILVEHPNALRGVHINESR